MKTATYVRNSSDRFHYRGYTIIAQRNIHRKRQWMWRILHPTIQGRGCDTITLESAYQHIDAAIKGTIAI